MTRVTKFSELWAGDRFRANGALWSKLDHETARKHSMESLQLGVRGAGYMGDPLCSFEAGDSVIFVDPTDGGAARDQARYVALRESGKYQPDAFGDGWGLAVQGSVATSGDLDDAADRLASMMDSRRARRAARLGR